MSSSYLSTVCNWCNWLAGHSGWSFLGVTEVSIAVQDPVNSCMRELDDRRPSASVGGRLVDPDGEADDLVVADAEVAGHNQLVGQVRLVVGAVPLGPDDD